MLNIYIDSREQQLYNNIIERDLDKYKDNITITKKQLELGDIIIEFDNDIQMIFERKTMNDLLSSITDGRYKEQKMRLLNNYKNINYLIEGSDIISSNNINKQQLLTSIYYHSIYRDNIKIFFNKNLNDTITFLLLLSIKIIDNPENFKSSSNEISTNFIDNCKIKSKKIDNIDKETCYLLQLAQIPGISKEIAKNIKDKYSSMSILLTTLTNSTNPNKILEDIPNIGQKKAKKIIEYLL